MLSYDHNGAVFYGCHIWHKWHEIPSIHLDGVWWSSHLCPKMWIITSRQTIEDFIEWLKPPKHKMLSHMPHSRPSCFLIDDAPQELKALWLVLYLVPIFNLFPWMFFGNFHKILSYFKCILCCTDPIHSWWFYYICVPIKVAIGMDKVPIFLCCWHVLKAWCLHGTEKFKDVEVWALISKTFMVWCTCPSIMEKQLMTSKNMGGLLWEETFTNIGLVMHG